MLQIFTVILYIVNDYILLFLFTVLYCIVIIICSLWTILIYLQCILYVCSYAIHSYNNNECALYARQMKISKLYTTNFQQWYLPNDLPREMHLGHDGRCRVTTSEELMVVNASNN